MAVINKSSNKPVNYMTTHMSGLINDLNKDTKIKIKINQNPIGYWS